MGIPVKKKETSERITLHMTAEPLPEFSRPLHIPKIIPPLLALLKPIAELTLWELFFVFDDLYLFNLPCEDFVFSFSVESN